MVSTLIKTKICIPRLRDGLVARAELVERLKKGLSCPLTLVSAPAGYGKTTLLAELAAQVPLAWLSLDEGDNDPVRFWSHFTAALQTKLPGIGQDILQTLGAFDLPSMRPLLVELINVISSGEPPTQPYILIMDDYHLIDDKRIHQDLEFLLEHLPQQIRLIISTRADPPLPLARMRARGQLSEFRAQELRFTPSEIDSILNGIMGLGLSREYITALEARTEGWIASLQMAAISMQKSQDIPAFISAFTGTHRHVIDYLTGEVLDRQTESIRSFLIETSILNHLSGPLCDAVTGRNDSQEILAQLESANLFLVSLDDERKWYRYHHLFASLLFSRLQQTSPGLVRELRLKAAKWLQQNGSEEAITYALAADDFDIAAQMIESLCGMYMLRSDYHTLLNLLAKMPEETFIKYPMLAILYASMYSNMGKIDAAEYWLKQVEGKQLPAIGQAVKSLSGIYVAIARQDDRKAIEIINDLIQQTDSAVNNTISDSEAANVMVMQIFPWHFLSHLQKAHGDLDIAIKTCRQALSKFGEFQLEAPFCSILALLHLTLGELLYERNDLAEALSHAATGMNIAIQSGNMSVQAYGASVLELVQQAQVNDPVKSEYQDSNAAISKDGRLDTKNYLCYPTHSLPLLTRTRFSGGYFTAVIHCIKNIERIADLDQWRTLALSWPGDTVDVAFAYAQLAERKYREASELLARLQERNSKAERYGNLIEILNLRALALQAMGNTAEAVGLVGRALTLAEPAGYVRIFVDMGVPMAALLKEAALQNITPEYVRRLLVEFKVVSPGRPSPTYPVAEPLTSRELEILRLLADGLSNEEIAQKLILTVGTVKTHTHHIYAKLGVGTRTQAIRQAISLNLL